MRLFGRGRLQFIGYTMAGFGVIFVGITLMQQGMGDLSTFVTPATLPTDTLIGRLQLVIFGILITSITQSSSAGVAAALTALYAHAINFEQAAAIVIGMNIGTTVTALIATIGGSVDSRRTGISHLIYNLFISAIAIILITPYTLTWDAIMPGTLKANAEIALVAFHTLFNTLGAIIVLPFTHKFAQLIVKLVPSRGPTYTIRLGKALLEQPSLAMSAVQDTLQTEFISLLKHVNAILEHHQNAIRIDLGELQTALDQTQDFVNEIHIITREGTEWIRLIAIIHTLDHMQRLHERCMEEEYRAIIAKQTTELKNYCQLLTESNYQIIDLYADNQWGDAARIAENNYELIRLQIDPLREAMMAGVASGEIDVRTGKNRLEAIRWLSRVSKHIARISKHFEQAVIAVGQ